jgi:hypothetical protein
MNALPRTLSLDSCISSIPGQWWRAHRPRKVKAPWREINNTTTCVRPHTLRVQTAVRSFINFISVNIDWYISAFTKIYPLNYSKSEIYKVFRKELYNGIPNFAVWRVLRKSLHLKVYKRSVKFFVTLATQQYLEYNCKSLVQTPSITS